jgi:hypothetical protein
VKRGGKTGSWFSPKCEVRCKAFLEVKPWQLEIHPLFDVKITYSNSRYRYLYIYICVLWFSNVKHNHPLGSHRQLLQVQQALHNTAWPCPIPFGSKATASGKPGQWVGIGFPPCSHKFSLGDRVHCFWKCKRGRLQKFSEKTAVNPIHLPSLWSQLDQPLLVALWKDLKQLAPLLGVVRVRRSTTNYSVYI